MTLRSVIVSTDVIFILSLLAVIVTLSLGRPHFSCKEARPEGLTGMKSNHNSTQSLNWDTLDNGHWGGVKQAKSGS